jgi:hypothetical protein
MEQGGIKTLGEIRKEYILKVLEQTGWDFGKASRILKIPEDLLRKEAKKIAPPGSGVSKSPPLPSFKESKKNTY